MLDLFDEFTALTAALDERAVAYAVCGGVALAVHGLPRATIDIDLLIPPEALADVLAIAAEKGYTLPAKPMAFANGAIQMQRRSKADPQSGDILSLDLLLVTPSLADVWAGREEFEWQQGRLWSVSRAGLIALKTLRNSAQDVADIEGLNRQDEEPTEN